MKSIYLERRKNIFGDLNKHIFSLNEGNFFLLKTT